jgi:hypothetical protein
LTQALLAHDVLDPDDITKRCDLLLKLGESADGTRYGGLRVARPTMNRAVVVHVHSSPLSGAAPYAHPAGTSPRLELVTARDFSTASSVHAKSPGTPSGARRF